MVTLGWRIWFVYGIPRVWFVSHLPGDGGKDWGYTDDEFKAIHLEPEMQAQFLSDMRACGTDGHLLSF